MKSIYLKCHQETFKDFEMFLFGIELNTKIFDFIFLNIIETNVVYKYKLKKYLNNYYIVI